MNLRTHTFLSGGKPIRLSAAESATGHRAPAVVLLHGSGGNTGFWLERIAPLVTRAGLSLFAIHYFDRTGTTRADAATLADPANARQWLETISDGLRTVAALPSVDPARIALAGVSLGAFLSLAWAAAGSPEPRPRCLVSISGGLIEPYASAANQNFPPTLIVHGTADTVVPVSNATALDALLTRLRVPHRLELVQGEGHWFTPAVLPSLLSAVAGFLAAQL